MTHKENFTFTSEYVSYGHPDKIADQISDLILDFYLQNYRAYLPKVAIETLATNDKIIVAGEISISFTQEDELKIKEKIINFIKKYQLYSHLEKIDDLIIEFIISGQSADISQLVIGNDELGAGDQGIMYGYANNDTANFMPAAIYYARAIIEEIFKNNQYKLGPDAKSQVTVEYKNGQVFKIKKILVSIQHPAEIDYKEVYNLVLPNILSVIPINLLDEDCENNILINPAGQFIIGGTKGDTGITGRKIIVDTYGGFAPHGGGAFSGKDPTKVDRSAAYAARYIAKNIVAAGIAEKCLVQIAYAIGIAQPFSFQINSFGTGIIKDEDLNSLIMNDILNLTPAAIIEHLSLWDMSYEKTAKNGHFYNNDYPWEKLDLVEKLKSKVIIKNQESLLESHLSSSQSALHFLNF